MSWLDLFIFFNFSFSQFWDEKEGPKSGSKSIGPISLFPSLLPLLYVSTFKAQIYKAYIKHKITQPQTQVQFHMLLFQKIFPFIFKKNRDLGNQVWHQEDHSAGLPSGWGQNREGVHDVRPQGHPAIWFWLRAQLQGQTANIAQDLNLLRNRLSYTYLLTYSRRQPRSTHQASSAIPVFKGSMLIFGIFFFYIGCDTSSPELK